MESLDNKISNSSISIKVQEKRTQFENRKLAIDKLKSNNKVRKATKPSRASQKRGIETKKRRGEIKRARQTTLEKNI